MNIDKASKLGLEVRREVRYYAIHPVHGGIMEWLYPDWTLEELDKKWVEKTLEEIE